MLSFWRAIQTSRDPNLEGDIIQYEKFRERGIVFAFGTRMGRIPTVRSKAPNG